MNQPARVPPTSNSSDPPDPWSAVLDTWMRAIDDAADLGGDRPRLAEYAADVVETLVVRPGAIGGALARFGQRLGSEGWPLEQVSGWIDRLGEICGEPAVGSLRSFRSGVSLAHGWTEGNLRGARAEECFDPLTGLCTVAVLRLRLQQVFEQCATAGQAPNDVHRLVIVDSDIAGVHPFEADAIIVALADLIQQHVMPEETITRSGGRIAVLVDDAGRSNERLEQILDEVRLRPLLRAAQIIGWVEDLPASSTQIDRFLADLSA